MYKQIRICRVDNNILLTCMYRILRNQLCYYVLSGQWYINSILMEIHLFVSLVCANKNKM